MPSAPARSGSAPPPATIDPRLKPPLFLLNLKCYPAALGSRADAMARSLAAVGREYGVSVGLVPSLPDLGRIAASDRLPILAPHCDPQPPGASTGFAIPEALRAAGALGSLVNHSEHRLSPNLLTSTVQRLRGAGLVAVLCTRDAAESTRWARLSPPLPRGGTAGSHRGQPVGLVRTPRSHPRHGRVGPPGFARRAGALRRRDPHPTGRRDRPRTRQPGHPGGQRGRHRTGSTGGDGRAGPGLLTQGPDRPGAGGGATRWSRPVRPI